MGAKIQFVMNSSLIIPNLLPFREKFAELKNILTFAPS